MVGHNSGAPGINAELWLLDDYTVIVLSNFDPPVVTQIADRAAELVTGSKPPALGGKVRLVRTQ